jgi:uncharacterized protein YndB with AHSA1/START domain
MVPGGSPEEQEGSMAPYRFETSWWTRAEPDRVWSLLADYAAWPSWWRGIRDVELIRRGEDSGVGSVLRQRWRSFVPYTLVFDLQMLRVDGPRLLEGRATGDLEGSATWTLAVEEDGTRVRFLVDVRTTRWWMNLPLPLASRVVRASFESIMRNGREGLEKSLGEPVVSSPPGQR